MTREEAIEVLQKNYPDSCYSILREAVDMAIEALSADRPTGKWVKSHLNEYCGMNEEHWAVFREVPCVKCDQCGEKRRNKENYCPNCGAYMRGENK